MYTGQCGNMCKGSRARSRDYRLNLRNSTAAQQLVLQFSDEEENTEEEMPAKDLSLDLFA